MASFSVKDDIERTVKELSINREGFFELGNQHWSNIIKKIEDQFLNKSDYKTTLHHGWEIFKEPTDTLQFVNQDGYKYFEELISDEPVYFVVEDTNYKMWIYEGNVKSIVAVIGNSYCLGEYYLVSKKYDWILCENHHRIVIGAGERILQSMETYKVNNLDKLLK